MTGMAVAGMAQETGAAGKIAVVEGGAEIQHDCILFGLIKFIANLAKNIRQARCSENHQLLFFRIVLFFTRSARADDRDECHHESAVASSNNL